MKVYYLVESDTDYASLFAWQLERIWAPELLAHVFRKPEGGHNFAEMNPAQFFGNLNSLLRTRITPGAPKINLAEPNLSAPELPSPPPVEVPPSGIDAEEAALADAGDGGSHQGFAGNPLDIPRGVQGWPSKRAKGQSGRSGRLKMLKETNFASIQGHRQ